MNTNKVTNFKNKVISIFQNKAILIIGSLLIVTIILIVLAFEIRSQILDNNITKLSALESAVEEWKSKFDSENPDADDNPDSEAILSTLMSAQFPNRSYPENRRIYLLAEIYELIEENELASDYYFQVAEQAYGYIALQGLLKSAFLQEEIGNTEEAKALFIQYIEDGEGGIEIPRVLFNLARIYEQESDYITAEEYYNRIIDDYTSSTWRNYAYNRIIELKSLELIGQ